MNGWGDWICLFLSCRFLTAYRSRLPSKIRMLSDLRPIQHQHNRFIGEPLMTITPILGGTFRSLTTRLLGLPCQQLLLHGLHSWLGWFQAAPHSQGPARAWPWPGPAAARAAVAHALMALASLPAAAQGRAGGLYTAVMISAATGELPYKH
ncbi:hypothetical protein HaLaN_13039 [Haematococcus lacustris]|uniref:Uncharacterized protein n=1 Tax=Haematococcus lacustris TaxID=44745 RepID=A0A699Z4V7_HAELA|nr:hypothetical protein HaLaN_13039 [Haematococcus lacustris]